MLLGHVEIGYEAALPVHEKTRTYEAVRVFDKDHTVQPLFIIRLGLIVLSLLGRRFFLAFDLGRLGLLIVKGKIIGLSQARAR